MKQILLIALTLGLSLHAGAILEASGGGTYSYGTGQGPSIWSYNVSMIGCDVTGPYSCWSEMPANIDGTWYAPGSYMATLLPDAGYQEFFAMGWENGVEVVDQEYETFASVVSNACVTLIPNIQVSCTEQFSFSAVATSPGFIFPTGQVDSVRIAAVPEPRMWQLMLGGLVLLGLTKRYRAGKR